MAMLIFILMLRFYAKFRIYIQTGAPRNMRNHKTYVFPIAKWAVRSQEINGLST